MASSCLSSINKIVLQRSIVNWGKPVEDIFMLFIILNTKKFANVFSDVYYKCKELKFC